MKRTIQLLKAAACAVAIGTAFAGGEGWTHDFEAAKATAAEKDQSLLMDFTGSDWCGWCIKLNEEVFSKDPFKEGVKDKFVLVELDYPQDDSKLSEETKEQNAKLQQEYAIQGYPTIILADAKGRPFATTGYQQGGPEKYVAHLDELLKKRTARDEAFANAAKLEGTAKAEALIAALDSMGLEETLQVNFYGDVMEQIKAADPEDKTGFTARMEEKKKFGDFETELTGFAQKNDHEGALAFVDETLGKGTFTGENQQQITLIKAMILAQLERFDESLKTLDEAKAVAPDSEMAGNIDMFKDRVGQMAEASKAAAGESEESGE